MTITDWNTIDLTGDPILAVGLHLVLHRTCFGYRLQAIGSNASALGSAARLAMSGTANQDG